MHFHRSLKHSKAQCSYRINQHGGRGYDRILKVSRTVASVEEVVCIKMHQVAEAINYRAFDRKLFG
jgi:predicted ATPase with chaperone activity